VPPAGSDRHSRFFDPFHIVELHMPDTLTALNQAARRLRRVPTYTVAVVVTLALGIGVSAAVFGLVNAVLLRPLPYRDASRLVSVRHTARTQLPGNGLSHGLTRYYRTQSRTFDDVGMYVERVATIGSGNEPERVSIVELTPNVLGLLGATPLVGRLPVDADYNVTPPYNTGVFLSYDLWMRHFGGDPRIVGQMVEIEGVRSTVVGVAPQSFHFPTPAAQAWLAERLEVWPGKAPKASVRELFYTGIGRLKPGVSTGDAQRDLQRLVDRIPDVFPTTTRAKFEPLGLRAAVAPYKEVIVGAVSTRLWLVLGTAAFLLLLTWANATNLAIVHAERQRRDIAVERALGASAGRLAIRCLAESAIVGLLAGGLAALIASAAINAQFGFRPDQVPRLADVRIDAAVAAVLISLTVLSALLVAGAELVNALRPERPGSLTQGLIRTTAGREQQGARRVLVGAQLAIALTLLIASGLMAQSFWRLMRVQLGFRPAGIYTFFLPSSQYSTYTPYARDHDAILTRLRGVPGIQSAEAATRGVFPVMPGPWHNWQRVTLADGVIDSAKAEAPLFGFATPGYFKTVGIPLLAGRTFQNDDMNPGGPGVILSASLAAALFGARSPLGQQIRWDPMQEQRFTVVGVVGDVPAEGIAHGPSKALYFPNVYPPPVDAAGKPFPMDAYMPNQEMYVLRTDLPAASVQRTVRDVVREVAPQLVVVDPRSLPEVVAASIAGTRLTMVLLLAAALTALLVGIIGIYGIQSYAVAQRTSELGIRIALGATPGAVIALVVRESARLAAWGIGAGLVTAFGVTRLMHSLLYGVRPGDPVVFAAMAVLLVAVALLASYVPARRIGRLDLIRALGGG
jgi:putative ABC transport system permease protein